MPAEIGFYSLALYRLNYIVFDLKLACPIKLSGLIRHQATQPEPLCRLPEVILSHMSLSHLKEERMELIFVLSAAVFHNPDTRSVY